MVINQKRHPVVKEKGKYVGTLGKVGEVKVVAKSSLENQLDGINVKMAMVLVEIDEKFNNYSVEDVKS